ncbi:hypothetical protein DRB89_42625 [Streptomyces sp. ICC4]|nr:hypothetical protein DRB89_42625 [Streptomyces sp. ICC4]
MDTSRLLRTTGIVIAAAGLLLSGCTSGGSGGPSASASSGAGSAAPSAGAGGGAHRPDRSPIPPRSPVSGAVPVPADPTALPGNGARVVTRPAEQAAGGAAGTADREGGAGGTGGSHGR